VGTLRLASPLSKEVYPIQSLRTFILKVHKDEISVSYIVVAEDSAVAVKEDLSLGEWSEILQRKPVIQRQISEDLNPQDL
jgi:hypothetical protein